MVPNSMFKLYMHERCRSAKPAGAPQLFNDATALVRTGHNHMTSVGLHRINLRESSMIRIKSSGSCLARVFDSDLVLLRERLQFLALAVKRVCCSLLKLHQHTCSLKAVLEHPQSVT